MVLNGLQSHWEDQEAGYKLRFQKMAPKATLQNH